MDRSVRLDPLAKRGGTLTPTERLSVTDRSDVRQTQSNSAGADSHIRTVRRKATQTQTLIFPLCRICSLDAAKRQPTFTQQLLKAMYNRSNDMTNTILLRSQSHQAPIIALMVVKTRIERQRRLNLTTMSLLRLTKTCSSKNCTAATAPIPQFPAPCSEQVEIMDLANPQRQRTRSHKAR